MDNSPLVYLIPILIPVAFVTFWSLVMNLLSSLSGWRKLALLYPATREPAGEHFNWRYATFGWVRYKNTVNFIAGREGLYMETLLMFRPGHGKILVPWSDIEARSHQGWLVAYIELRFRQDPGAKLTVHRHLGEQILAAAGQKAPS